MWISPTVHWTDESKFELFGTKQGPSVWIKPRGHQRVWIRFTRYHELENLKNGPLIYRTNTFVFYSAPSGRFCEYSK